MRIARLAERAGVPVTTLRFYEKSGLVPAERSAAGYRLYGAEALERLGFIAAAKHLGLTLEEIGELLEVWEHGACAQVKSDLHPRLAARLAEAETRRAEVDTFIRELRRAMSHLEALPDRDARCDTRCGFPSGDVATEAADAFDDALDDVRDDALDTPVACSLRPGELQEHAARWRELLAGGRRRDTEDGVTVSVPAERAGELAALCVAEQECCPFFGFTLRLDGATVHLDVRAPHDARELAVLLLNAASPS